ncbi:MAG: T9SS type B sorting domain-containing protein [Paludibacteraceae bacterium]|nr:T9SS type B sorting domain-containing protein [Paludibacteraceae bacterium]
MKFKFVHILKFCIAALAISFSINASAAGGKEWRDVFRMDFGGDSSSDRGMCTKEPSSDEIITDLPFLSTYKHGASAGKYFLAKSTADIKAGSYSAMADCHWVDGSDHTYPNDKTKGYSMMFDVISEDDEFRVFEKSLPISCTGVNFRFSCWFANLAALEDDEDCLISIGIYTPTGDLLAGGDYEDIFRSKTGELDWIQKMVTFKVPESADYSSVSFKIFAINCHSMPGWDFAMDDILIEVEQPILSISNSTDYSYKKPVDLVAEYDMDNFKNFFGDDFSNVKYRWEYSSSKKGPWVTKTTGTYKSGSNMPYTIEAFEKDNTNGQGNGFYRLTVATSGNMDNSFCSIQQVFEINEQKDKCYVTICQGETKTILSHTLKSTDTEVDKGSIVFYVTEYKYKVLDPVYDETCVNEDNKEPGDKFLETKIEKIDVDSETRCVSTKQDYYLRVIESPNLPTKDLCQRQKYNGTAYSNVDETGRLEVEIDSLNCKYKQVLLVHPTYDMEVDEIVCLGETFQGRTFNTPGQFKGNKVTLKSIYGCDSVVTPNILVPEKNMPPVIEMDPICQGPEVVVKFGQKIYRDPMDAVVSDTIKNGSVLGCDSISRAHITIYPSGSVGPFDTLICRDQILFGEEFKTAGDYVRTRHGVNSLGCPNDTTWNIHVVEVQLKLRVAFMGDNPVICKGTPLDLVVTLLPPNADFRWEPSIGTNSIKPTIWPDKTTTYTAFADLDLPSDIDHDAKGCHAKAELTVDVHPQPTLSIDSVDTDTRNVEYSVDGGTKPYNLFVDGKNVVSESTDYFGTLEKQPFGNHTLQLVDSIGCSSESDFVIEAKPLEPDVLVTPNFDGQNDRWAIRNIDIYPTAKVKIFDRLGRVVYKCDGNYSNEEGFDGTYNGEKLPATDYWYEIDIEELDKQYVGHFTLMR